MRLVEQLRKQEQRLHTVYGSPAAGAALSNPMVPLQGQLPSLFGDMKQEVRPSGKLKGMVDMWLLGNASTCEGIFLLSSYLLPRLAVVLLVESSNRTQRPLPLPQGLRTLMHLEPHRLCLAIWGFVLPPLWQATFHPSSPLLSWDRYVCSLEDWLVGVVTLGLEPVS